MNKEKLIYLDVETTGVDDTDRLCQVAYKVYGKEPISNLYKPPVDISVKAMSVTHITNEHVKDKPEFKGSDDYNTLKKLFEEEDYILVAHNSEFDKGMIEKEGINVNHHICTYKLAHHLDTNDETPEYNLQYLRYYLGLDTDGAIAHDALGDIIVLEQLFLKQLPNITIEEMIEVTKKPILLKSFNFGKHKGVPLSEVPRGYLEWLSSQENVEEDKKYSCDYHLGRLQ